MRFLGAAPHARLGRRHVRDRARRTHARMRLDGDWFSASTILCAVFRASSTLPFFTGAPRAVAGALRMCSYSADIAGNGVHGGPHFDLEHFGRADGIPFALRDDRDEILLTHDPRTRYVRDRALIDAHRCAARIRGADHSRVEHAGALARPSRTAPAHHFLGDHFLRIGLSDNFVRKGSFGFASTVMSSVLPYCLFHLHLVVEMLAADELPHRSHVAARSPGPSRRRSGRQGSGHTYTELLRRALDQDALASAAVLRSVMPPRCTPVLPEAPP